MSAPRRVLVVGSYPPIPLPAAAATVAAVRRAWADGDEVTVVSPRLSAAHLAVPVVGLLAARRLDNLRRHTAATRLVMVLEPGVPVPLAGPDGGAGHLIQWQTVRALRKALVRFEWVTLVRTGPFGLPSWLERDLLAAANEVIHDDTGSRLDTTAGRVPGVTAVGPVEVLPHERPRQVAGLVAHRLLGRRAASVRAGMGAIRHRLRT